jgi:hypothetical protein
MAASDSQNMSVGNNGHNTKTEAYFLMSDQALGSR